jgi:hypothetical protein
MSPAEWFGDDVLSQRVLAGPVMWKAVDEKLYGQVLYFWNELVKQTSYDVCDLQLR